MSKSETICLLCGVPAAVTSPLSDRGLQTTSQTDCPACGLWGISHRDFPKLKKQAAGTKQRIAKMARQHSKKNPGVPFVVNDGLILHASMMK